MLEVVHKASSMDRSNQKCKWNPLSKEHKKWRVGIIAKKTQFNWRCFRIWIHTVDGLEIPNNHLLDVCHSPSIMEINYQQPQLVSLPDFFHEQVPSLKLRYPLKIDPWKRRFLLETIIFRGYVSFREGIFFYPIHSSVGKSPPATCTSPRLWPRMVKLQWLGD